jgi:sortase A
MNTTTAPDPASEPDAEASADESTSGTGRPIRLVLSAIGVAMVLIGGSMLAYVAWEYYGTDIVARHRQADIRADLEARWRYPTVADVVGPDAAGASLGSAVALIRIPAFGSGYEVPMIEGVRDSDLADGIGHFPGAGPGQIGNFALAAHRVTHGEPFRHLPDLKRSDEIIVETADAIYRYVLDTNPSDLVVPFTDGWVLDAVPTPPEGESPPPGMLDFGGTAIADRAIITLTTCSELFHTDDRMVAFGHLVSTVPK